MEFLRQTAFDRPTDIYIQNNTNEDFQLHNVDLQSGVITKQPPNIIKAGGNGLFNGDQTGLVGSSGFVTYKVKLRELMTYITFYWSHPEGATSSIYYGYSSPFGVFYVIPQNNYDATQKPSTQTQKIKNWIDNHYSNEDILVLNPTGHVQSVTYTVQYGLGHI
ncbi:hypothetical protein [Clostridium massiliodielmoense]|uniref:hypothetical protein n=1 Tax=Clostridium massiliodielmoense TaxID=1776385 RepID=UPI00016674FD|nr:hypothetical protein [Clostridium massiliodielmoense]EDS77510.1 conserved hypothetical protein [Clostridium botulinum C str. Eklund]